MKILVNLFCFVLAYFMVGWFVVVQDDCDNVTRFLMLAREPVIPRNDRPFKVLLLFLQLSANGHFPVGFHF